MKIFQEEWNAGFDKTIVDPPNPQDLLDNTSGSRTSPITTVFGSRIVIDDILLYGTNVNYFITSQASQLFSFSGGPHGCQVRREKMYTALAVVSEDQELRVFLDQVFF